MRNLVLLGLLLLLLVAGSLGWYAISGDRSADTIQPALGPGGGLPLAVENGSSRDPGVLPPSGPAPPATADGTLRAIEGTVRDRFGFPVSGERVFLLSAEQDHPTVSTPIEDYVKTLTSSEGRFVLTTRLEGPWRLSVGPPGEPRIPPSEPKSPTGTIQAEVIVPGSAAVRVALAELPETELPLVLEVMLLEKAPPPPAIPPPVAPPAKPLANPGTPITRKEAASRDRSDKDAEAAAEEEGGSQSTKPVRGARTLGEGQDDDGTSIPLDRSGGARDATDPGGYRGIAPPAEKWRPVERRRITAPELVEGFVGIPNLPIGEILRLNLMVGSERAEGNLRFVPRKDTLIEVRIVTVTTRPARKFSYVTSLEVLAPDESPPGVRWLD